MNKSILSTKILTQSQKSLLLNAGISLVEYDAISITLLDITIEHEVENAIITSQNTIDAVLKKNIKIKNCFCVGEKTKALLEQNNFKVIENTDYGKNLAEKIIKSHKDKAFTFFCGNRRLDDIPAQLKKHNVVFEETEVYHSHLNSKKFARRFDGVLFFSPSGVESFVLENSLGNTVAFCIGTTTASEAEKHTDKIVIATKPTVENVIVQVVKTFAPLPAVGRSAS